MEQITSIQPDDILALQQTQAEQLLSYGAITPADYEGHFTADIESSMFIPESYSSTTEHLQAEAERSPLLAYELRALSTTDLTNSLHRAGVISDALYESGTLQERFRPDEVVDAIAQDGTTFQSHTSGLKHILLGDGFGGLHDMDTVVKAGLAGEGTDTKSLRIKQKQNATSVHNLRVGHPIDSDSDGSIDAVYLEQRERTQFPAEWSADRVLLAIVDAADMGREVPVDQLPASLQRLGWSRRTMDIANGDTGFQIVVDIDENGKIATGFPRPLPVRNE